MKKPLLALVVVLATPGILSAQGGPVGSEFRVNTYTTGTQRFRSVAAGGNGNAFVVTWESANQDGSQYGVFAQRYGFKNGAPLGSEFKVNSYTTSDQSLPKVASDANDNFVVVWQSDGQDGDNRGIYAQRYAAAGFPLGGEFRVNTFTTFAQSFPAAAMYAPGAFMVVWQSAQQDGSGYGIFGQRYADTGAPLGPEFRINTYTPGSQRFPAVATDSSGNFVVTWEGYAPNDQGLGIFAQRYSTSGAPLGGEFRVNSYTIGNQRYPAVDDIAGFFTIVWQSDGQDGDGYGVFAQRYDNAGAPVGGEFQVNTYTTLNQVFPDVMMGIGRFYIIWQSDLQDGSSSGVFTRFYLSGSPTGPDFRMNTYTTGPQTAPGVADGGLMRFVFVWTSAQDPDGSPGIYAQRWGDIPVELQDFTVE